MSFDLNTLIESKGMERGQFLNPTTESTLILERVRKTPSKKNKGVDIIALEFYVAATKDPNADPVGSRTTELFKFDFDQQKNATKADVLRTIFNALGLDSSDLRKVFADAETGRGDLARGASVKVTAWHDEAKHVQKKWIPIRHVDPLKAMAECRAILDDAKPAASAEDAPF